MTARVTTLVSLAHAQFRNLQAGTFVPGPRFNVISGDNGEGKSSLLEALGYALGLQSFRSADSEALIAWNASASSLKALTRSNSEHPLPSEHRVQLFRGGTERRRVELDGKRPRSLRDFQLRAPVVTFHPGDLALTSGGPAARREYMDRILALSDATYADVHKRYHEALRSRNRLLKDEAASGAQWAQAVHAYDPILIEAGTVLVRARAHLLARVGPLVESVFKEVFGEGGALTLRYAPKTAAERMSEAFAERWTKDVQRGYTTAGPHADEVELWMDGRRMVTSDAGLALADDEVSFNDSIPPPGGSGGELRYFGSQGQQRLCTLALKLAEVAMVAEATSVLPIVLLDDVGSELDRRRSEALFRRLADLGGQTFLTTTHAELIPIQSDRVDFQVSRGAIQPRTS